MALTPVSEDAFVREVDEELRRDQLGSVWRRYGRLIIAAIVLALALLAAGLYWQHLRAQQADARAETLAGALADIGEGKGAPAAAALATLAGGKDQTYAAAAKLTQAGIALSRGDAKVAAQTFSAIAADEDAPKALRDLALVRAIAADFDALPPQQVIDRLKPLAIPGAPWFGSAGEMTAVAYLKLGRPQLAGPIFAALAKDKTVPETLRARAVRISGMLGVDVIDAAQEATKG